MFKRLRTAFAAATLTVATGAAAFEPAAAPADTYVVQSSDTLWDIAGRLLQKPWQWPQLWQVNPQLHDPHLLYPGDVLSLAHDERTAVAGRLQPGPRQQAPIDAIALSEVAPFLKNLRVSDSFETLPYVVALEDNRLRAVAGQLAYIADLNDTRPGQRYAVVRPSVRFSLPRLNQDLEPAGEPIAGSGHLWKHYAAPGPRRETLGYEMVQVNLGTITHVADGHNQVATLRLQDSGQEVRAGDRLIAVEPIAYDPHFFPHPPTATAAAADLRVLAVADAFTTGGTRDVIAISGGTREGIDNGTVLSIWRPAQRSSDRIKRSRFSRPDDATRRLPDEYAAHALVFRSFDKVSYALVMEGIKPARVGYALKHPDAR